MSNREAEGLVERYARMSDGELELVAASSEDLTDEARTALEAELDKRRLSVSVIDPPQPASDEQWSELKRFSDMTEAGHTKDSLAAAGIESQLTREHSSFLVDRVISNLLGNVKLMVKPEDLEPARDILDQPVEYERDLQSWSVLKRFRDLPEATLAKGAVESAGIECHLTDENMVRLDWFISNLLGGVKLVVRPEDLEAARQILDQPTPSEIEFDEGQSFDQPSCPKCGSFDVRIENPAKGVALASLYMIALPLPIEARRSVCDACGARWVEGPERPTDISS